MRRGAGGRVKACRYCGAPMSWGCRAGQWLPLNADGSEHFCKGESRFIPDVNFKPGKRVVGPNYKPSCGECGVPPWETCPCSELLAGVAAMNAAHLVGRRR